VEEDSNAYIVNISLFFFRSLHLNTCIRTHTHTHTHTHTRTHTCTRTQIWIDKKHTITRTCTHTKTCTLTPSHHQIKWESNKAWKIRERKAEFPIVQESEFFAGSFTQTLSVYLSKNMVVCLSVSEYVCMSVHCSHKSYNILRHSASLYTQTQIWLRCLN
jgi:hypothetical protein